MGLLICLPAQNERNTLFFFNYFSILLPFGPIFISQIHARLFNLSRKFQPYRVRIGGENYQYVTDNHMLLKPNFDILLISQLIHILIEILIGS